MERLDGNAYLLALMVKLSEEAEEFAENPSLEELADVEEVVQTLGRLLGGTKILEAARQAKVAERGGFDGRLFMTWESDEE